MSLDGAFDQFLSLKMNSQGLCRNFFQNLFDLALVYSYMNHCKTYRIYLKNISYHLLVYLNAGLLSFYCIFHSVHKKVRCS